jgi:hypothetical protein
VIVRKQSKTLKALQIELFLSVFAAFKRAQWSQPHTQPGHCAGRQFPATGRVEASDMIVNRPHLLEAMLSLAIQDPSIFCQTS